MCPTYWKSQLRRWGSLALVFFCLTSVSCSNDRTPPAPALPLGSLYEIALEGTDGRTIDFKSFQGKVIVLDFFASWCEPCKDTAPLVERVYQEYGKRGIVVLGISLDVAGNRNAVNRFAGKHGITFPVVIDDGRIREVTGVFSVPTTIVLDQSGTVRAKIMGARRDLYDRIRRELEALK
jgi:thiol-disulfide isomerase/thioredoxin